MKKLAVLAMIPALALFMAATMASADGHHWRGFHGDYAMIATGNCLHSPAGFTGLVPNSPLVWGASIMAQAIWTFDSDGTGTVKGTNYVIDFPPANPPTVMPGVRQNPVLFTFQYYVTSDGAITVTQQTPLGPLTLVGMISRDHKTLTLGNANQVGPSLVGPAICNIGRVLIRVKEMDE
jgi:hypothetical protein